MSKVEPKKIKFSDIKTKAKELEKKDYLYLDVETGECIEYYPKFGNIQIDKLLTELVETVNYVDENKLGYFDNDLQPLNYLQFLIVKHFTQLRDEMKNKSVEVHFATFFHLYDIGLLDLFLDDTFEQDEVNKVLEKYYAKAEAGTKLLDIVQKAQKQLVDKVENKEVLNKQ